MSTISARPVKRVAVKVEGWVCQSCRRQALRSQKRAFHVRRPLYRDAAPTRHDEDTNATNLTRKPILPDKPARTRFAPSPTGHLHIGGLRTALFSYLLARRTAGQFLLRIEDTDQKRLVPGAEQRLVEDLQWAGLDWDEGPEVGGPHGPYRQSERNDIYQRHAHELLDGDTAYRCFCSTQTVRQDYVISGCHQNCASLSKEESQDKAHDKHEPFTVRLRPPEDTKKRVYPDLVYGKITPLKRSPTAIAATEDDAGNSAADVILIKSDGTPTYHFANVVDDHLMKITHVIRGSEWMASTPLHYDLYHAFGWTPPTFAHVGLLVDENKAKLSKRNMGEIALDVRSMREDLKVLPEALCNFLALLGWSSPTKSDVLDMQELTDIFDLKFTKGNAMVKMDKLWYLQKRHVARRCEAVIAHLDAYSAAQQNRNPGFEHDEINVLLTPMVEAMVPVVQKHFPYAAEHIPAHFKGDLARYCQAILMTDGENYTNPEQYVERYKYLFDFDPTLVPEEKEYYDKKTQTIDADTVFDVVHNVLGDFGEDWVEHSAPPKPFLSPEPKPDNAPPLATPKISASDARAAAKLDSHDYFYLITTSSLISGRIDMQVANHLNEHKKGEWNRDDQSVKVEPARLKNATMKFLREKLCYGLPGPHMPNVMALLGYEECCRRLGFRGEEEGDGDGV